jgi:UDP-glucose 4-epimerase/UDP-glucuronate decarboxylase
VRALVTGAGGFIGYHTAVALAEAGHQAVLVDNFSRQPKDAAFAQLLAHPCVTSHQLDLMQEESWKTLGGGYDAIFHLAGINGTRFFYQRPHHVLDTNVQLMRLMLAWHRRFSPGTHVVWTSSSEVYAGVPGLPIPTPEEVPVGIPDVFNPRYSYAVSKLTGELLLINYARDQQAAYTVVRPHNIYGPRMGQEHVIPEFSLRIKRREEPFRIFGGVETRAFCYVTDFVSGLTAIPEASEAQGQVIHLGDDRQEIRIIDLAEKMFQVAGWHPDRVEVQPAPAGSVARRCPCLAKARKILRLQPKTSLEQGLRETYDWYAHH